MESSGCPWLSRQRAVAARSHARPRRHRPATRRMAATESTARPFVSSRDGRSDFGLPWIVLRKGGAKTRSFACAGTQHGLAGWPVRMPPTYGVRAYLRRRLERRPPPSRRAVRGETGAGEGGTGSPSCTARASSQTPEPVFPFTMIDSPRQSSSRHERRPDSSVPTAPSKSTDSPLPPAFRALPMTTPPEYRPVGA